MLVLGIETSCDETGVALYSSTAGLLAHQVYSQTKVHEEFGGVVPELASRDHIRKTLPMIQSLLKETRLELSELDGIAYTAGPGLIGALMVAGAIGRSLAYALEIPAIGVHHMEGHLLSPKLENEKLDFPFLALLVSGGHTLLIKVFGLGQYEVLGESIDDAVGEAFDKTAKLLDLPYPGGALLSKLAEQGVSGRFNFPRPMLNRPGFDFSFSGLKTSVLRATQQVTLDAQTKADIAKSFEEAVVETLTIKCQRALRYTGLKDLVIGGGVGANKPLRHSLNVMSEQLGAKVHYPRIEFCTDNGAMIAYVGCLRLLAGEQDDLAIKAKPRWPLSEFAQE